MTTAPRFFSVRLVEGVTEMVLGTADFVSRPIIVLARDEILAYLSVHAPPKVVINFKNVRRISSEFINAMLTIQDQVKSRDGELKLSHLNQTLIAAFQLTKLAERFFRIYETTPQAIDAF